MGTYFYRNPLLTYTCQVNGTTVTTKNESDLTNVNKESYYPNNFLLSPIVFNSKFNTGSLATIYGTQINLSVVANNVFGSTSSSNPASITQNVIVDGPSNTLVYSTFPTSSIPILQTNTPNTAGYRVWSATSVSNNCPDLKYNGTTYYRTIKYDNEWDIASDNNNDYDATTELLVSNGRFRTKGNAGSSAGYLDYTNSLYNSTIDYSGIPASGLRFATFCWKLTQKTGTPSYYQNLSFTINSISNPSGAPGSLKMNNSLINIFYLFQDESPSNSSRFSSDVFNSVWIDGNSNTNEVTTANYYDITKPYGHYSGLSSSKGGVVITGTTTATINVFIPLINSVSDSTYLYLRLGIPMDVSISFGSVTATIS
jgi:hypothetical protein